MAKLTASLATKIDRGDDRKQYGLFLYPDTRATLVPLDREEHTRLLQLLHSKVVIRAGNRIIRESIEAPPETGLDADRLPTRLWSEIAEYIGSKLAEQVGPAEVGEYQYSLVQRFAYFDRLQMHVFFRRCFKYNDLDTSVRPELVGPYWHALNLAARESFDLSRALPLDYAYDFLAGDIGKRIWLEKKYDRRSSTHSLAVIARKPFEEPLSSAELYLMGLEYREIEKIESGFYDGMDKEEISGIGDLISHAPLRGMQLDFEWAALEPIRYFASRILEIKKELPNEEADDKVDVALVTNKYSSSVIDPKDIVESKSSIAEKLDMIDAYAKEHPGKPVAHIIKAAFSLAVPRHTEMPTSPPDFPATAPELWRGGRNNPESPPEFLRRVYEPWIGNGLSKPMLRRLDPRLLKAIYNWEGAGNILPDDLRLPSQKHVNDLLLADETVIEQHLGRFTGKEALREAARIKSAKDRRER